MRCILVIALVLASNVASADTIRQSDLDRIKGEYELCAKLAEYYSAGNPEAYLIIVDEVKKRGFGRKCLTIAEVMMAHRAPGALTAFREALKEIPQEDYPRETRRKGDQFER